MRTRLAVLIGMLVAGGCAHGQSAGPGYYRVTGTGADVRAEPGAEDPTVGRLGPGTGPVEVVRIREAASARWGLVATQEGAGWVPMSGLEPVELPGVLDTAVPANARCTGTEPFWGLTFDDGTAVFEDPFAEPRRLRLPIDTATRAAGRFSPILLSFANDRGHALIDRGLCSDGMSDIPYGWSARLILGGDRTGDGAGSDRTGDGRAGDAGPRLLSGCCRVAPGD